MRRVHSLLHPFFFLSLLLATFCSADLTSSFHVSGNGECADCLQNNLKTTQAFPGLRVSIDCKLENGGMQRIAEGDLDEQGEFNVPIPKEVVDESGKKLKQECYAQLHSARATPCPIHNGIESAKIVFKKFSADGTTTFAPVKNIKFPSALCSSKNFIKFPPLPTLPPHPWFKPPVYKPPVTVTPPVYKPPVYTPPVYKPPVEKPPVYKPPVYKPPVEKPPVYKPPVYKPPVYKPPVEKPPVYKPPVYKPPVEKPPVYKPPVYKPPVVVPPVYKPPVATPPVFVHPPFPFFKHPFPKVLPPPFPLFKHPFPKPLPPLPPLPKFPPLPPHPKPKIPSTISHP